MGRLTRKMPGGRYGLVEGISLDNIDDIRKVVDRLAAYENTELEPEEVAELAQAEKDGRLVMLPCKVGDTVYVIPSEVNYDLNIINGHPEANRVYAQPVREIRFYKCNVFLLVTCDGTQTVHSDFFGTTWFLTREAAQAALEGEEALKDGDAD